MDEEVAISRRVVGKVLATVLVDEVEAKEDLEEGCEEVEIEIEVESCW